MADEENAGLTDEAKTYFESRGEVTKPEPEVDKSEVDAADPEAGDPEAETGHEDDHDEDRQPKVPLRALKKEREELRELKRQFQEEQKARQDIERQNAVLADRWNTMLQIQTQQEQPQPEPPPDPDKDIFAYAKWQADQLKALGDKLSGQEKEQAEARQAAERESQIWNYWEADTAEYSKSNADFGNAAKWLAEYRDKQLTALGKFDQRLASKQGRDQQINAELKDIIVRAAQAKMSPAQAIYEIAQGYGYTMAAPKTGAEEIDAINKAADGAETLSGGGGDKPLASVDAKAVANMSEAEFSAWLSKKGDAGFRKLMGG